MEQIELSGFQMCHLDSDQHSVLREKRVVLGMTQQQVADKAGIILQQYQKFESGERDIMTSSFRTACKVIEALEMDITDFYHGECLTDGWHRRLFQVPLQQRHSPVSLQCPVFRTG